jgi:ring-1,2-phenylacetyl-CoA epoxidase subunit PaaD
MVRTVDRLDLEGARTAAASVVDPEIPVLTIDDLGVLRDVEAEGDRIVVTITPTYSGCPAMRQISDDVMTSLAESGFTDAEVRTVHSPAWTTDWMSEEARQKLQRFGIAPPTGRHEVVCPRCRSSEPTTVSEFGSTACKALLVCSSCGEPFDYFKEI